MRRTVEFNNLKPLHDWLRVPILAAITRVIDRGCFILGPEVEAFESAFAAYHGVDHAVGVANGTDALELALLAGEVGPGDEVITVAHTAVATVCAIEQTGATPVLVDIDDATCTMDPVAAAAAITPQTKAILPVHLYGHPADLGALRRLADRHGLLLVEDCAQAHGARLADKPVGTFGHFGAFSFYPTKNLGALGDGGAVITNDPRLAERLRRLRNYGQRDRYHHEERGINSRLDEMQAAILNEKLKHLDTVNAERRRLAGVYARHLQALRTPIVQHHRARVQHAFHLYVVRHPQRDQLRALLHARGIGTLVHYPVPVHLQPAYTDLRFATGALPVTEQVAAEVMSLPLYYGMSDEDVARVAECVNECAGVQHSARAA